MGGMPALLLLATGYEGFERAVLCAPMTRLFREPMNTLTGFGANAACLFGLDGVEVARGEDDSESFDGNMFTTDPQRHERFRQLKIAEPKAALSSPTYGWVREAMRASAELHKADFFKDLKTPVRIITAGEEKRVDASDHALMAAASTLIDQVTIPGALHEIMMERDEIQDVFWKEAFGFLGASAAS